MKISWDSILTLIIRLTVGMLFIISGVAKLFALGEFVETVYQFNLLPGVVAPYFALFLPVVEYLLGVCLFLGLFTRWTKDGRIKTNC